MKKLILLLLVLFVVSCSKDPIIYTLVTSANPADGGTVSPPTQQYEEGKTATIIASPTSDYLFQSWSGATGSTNSTSIVMNSDKTVTANFVKKKFALTVSVEGEGTVTEKVIKAGAATDYTIGSVIELTANPSDEWLFVEWKGDVTGTKNPVEITIDKAKNVLAVFVKKQYPLTIDIEGEGTVAEKVIKAGAATDYNSGTIVELTAEPSDKWEFVEWTGDLESTENPAEITIDGSKTVKAVFQKIVAYLDDNGVTVKAYEWAEVGDTTKIGGHTYTIVDLETLKVMIANDEDLTKVITTKVTNMSALFRDTKFNQEIGSWDTSNVTNMNMMFRDSPFNGDISKWDVSNVSDMSSMFSGTPFNQDIGSWDTGNTTLMNGMFAGASLFDQDIGDWDVSNVTRIGSMFSETPFNQDISDWDVSKVYDMGFTFHQNEFFNQDIGNWDVSSVTNMGMMFVDSEFNQDISNWNVSNVEIMNYMFSGTPFNQDIGDWDVSNVTQMGWMFNNAQEFNQDLTKWCVSNIISEPRNFSTNSPLEESFKPVWGISCAILDLFSSYPSDLVSYYPFNGNANDMSGNKNNGEVRGAELVSDKDENSVSAYKFSSGDYILTPFNSDYNSDKITITAWVKADFDDFNQNYGAVVARHDGGCGGNNGADARFYVEKNGSIYGAYGAGNLTQYDIKSEPSIITNNTWSHIAYTFDNKTMKLYYNGELVKSIESFGTIPSNDCNTFSIGSAYMSNGVWYKFTGIIDDVSIWKRALKENEIKEMYNNYKP